MHRSLNLFNQSINKEQAMKNKQLSALFATFVLVISTGSYAQGEFPTFKGAYLGQKTPGMTAKSFAPGVISKEGWQLEGVFAPGMKEFFYTMDRGINHGENKTGFQPTVIGYRLENNTWTKFTEFLRTGEIVFSPDGSRMHMAEGYKDRTANGWSETKSLGPMFDHKDWGIMRLSASAKGTYVFDDYKSDDVIRVSKVVNGKRQTPEKLPDHINTGKWTAHPFIAPDESYLIWDSEREGGYGNSDLYISFRQQDGSWGKAINMGSEINSDKSDFYASVTPDGKYILFNRTINQETRDIDIYWVSAEIIEKLRP